MIYRTLLAIVKISLSVFFKKIVVNGAENIPATGPLIIAANHPNTLMDPLIVASIPRRRIGFVANVGIFSNKLVGAVLGFFHVIPITRKKDIAPGEKPDNSMTFARCHDYLADGNSLLIFPEGSSYYELKIRDIKTGTARIALSFEALRNFEGGLKILPVTLDYSDSLQFRSLVSVTVNPPLSVAHYREAWTKNEFDCVNTLTDDIRKELLKNVPHTSGKDMEDFLIKGHKFYTAFYDPAARLHGNPGRSLEVRTELAKALTVLRNQESTLYDDTQTKLNTFFSKLQSLGLTTGFFTDSFLRRNKTVVCGGYLLQFILLLPVYLFGLITNYIPYILPSKVFGALKIDIEYKSSVQMIVGLISFPLFYVLELVLFRRYVHEAFWSSGVFLLALTASGYLVMYYWLEAQRFARVVYFYFSLDHSTKSELLALRDEILKRIEEGKGKLN